uniref:Proteasomal ubiquitin receptor ADRM1-B-like n=2 Tax=Nicotiana TaxID=4085 RepID=A0A1S4D631_TOBAC|nr:PREDICTED: proteasomal ubiquitin receptor ADRM1-B-like [Nicotiana sylvestris]XP_016508798.1 PREDICTED: proteasomal ubiquitin receptor ADRM1-B-like [Nicotiana tabacum]
MPQNPDNASGPILVDTGSQGTQQVNEVSHTDESIQHINQQEAQQTPARETQESHPKTPSIVAPEIAPRTERVPERSSNNGSITDPTIAKMLGDLSKRIESSSWRFMQQLSPEEAVPEPVSRKFGTPELPTYDRISDPEERTISYTYAGKGSDLQDDEFEPVSLKKFGETLSKGTIMWRHNLAPDLTNSLTIPADSSAEAHADAIEAATGWPDTSEAEQRENEMPEEVAPHSLME